MHGKQKELSQLLERFHRLLNVTHTAASPCGRGAKRMRGGEGSRIR
ncbi:hypothetical protein [Mitsuokella jalaludinii]